jgi:hypothetical protein
VEDRRRKIRRLLSVQQKMHQLAELRLAQLSRKGAELDEAQLSLIRALNEDGAFHGLFVDAMARRLERLATEADRVKAAKAEQAARVLAQARRMKTTEKISGKLDRASKREKEKVDFRALLDAFAQLGDASSA